VTPAPRLVTAQPDPAARLAAWERALERAVAEALAASGPDSGERWVVLRVAIKGGRVTHGRVELAHVELS